MLYGLYLKSIFFPSVCCLCHTRKSLFSLHVLKKFTLLPPLFSPSSWYSWYSYLTICLICHIVCFCSLTSAQLGPKATRPRAPAQTQILLFLKQTLAAAGPFRNTGLHVHPHTQKPLLLSFFLPLDLSSTANHQP